MHVSKGMIGLVQGKTSKNGGSRNGLSRSRPSQERGRTPTSGESSDALGDFEATVDEQGTREPTSSGYDAPLTEEMCMVTPSSRKASRRPLGDCIWSVRG